MTKVYTKGAAVSEVITVVGAAMGLAVGAAVGDAVNGVPVGGLLPVAGAVVDAVGTTGAAVGAVG